LLLSIGWGTLVAAFIHINEVKGASQRSACLVTWDSERGLWDKEITTVDGKVVVDGQDLEFSGESQPGDWSFL